MLLFVETQIRNSLQTREKRDIVVCLMNKTLKQKAIALKRTEKQEICTNSKKPITKVDDEKYLNKYVKNIVI